MLNKTRFMLVAALLAGSASGAMAQSFDPSVGSGNIASVTTPDARNVNNTALDAHAQVPRAGDPRGTAQWRSSAEKALFERIPVE